MVAFPIVLTWTCEKAPLLQGKESPESLSIPYTLKSDYKGLHFLLWLYPSWKKWSSNVNLVLFICTVLLSPNFSLLLVLFGVSHLSPASWHSPIGEIEFNKCTLRMIADTNSMSRRLNPIIIPEVMETGRVCRSQKSQRLNETTQSFDYVATRKL